MKDFNGTPGPWIQLPEELDRPYIRIRGTRLGERYKVANVLSPVHEGVSAREAEQTRANARLIAAAPQLLELVQTTNNSRNGCHTVDWQRKAKALLIEILGE